MIKDLRLGMSTVFVVGVVAARQEPASFADTKSMSFLPSFSRIDPGRERWRFSFTLRDSVRDMINLTWFVVLFCADNV